MVTRDGAAVRAPGIDAGRLLGGIVAVAVSSMVLPVVAVVILVDIVLQVSKSFDRFSDRRIPPSRINHGYGNTIITSRVPINKK